MNKFYNFFVKRHFTQSNHPSFNKSLKNLRNRMIKEGYDGYILVNSDAHKNEYLSEKDQKIKSLSNFSGSNAIAFISLKDAILWTDSRYYLQAEKELDKSDWKMLPIEDQDITDYINNYFDKGKKIGVDLKTISVSYFKSLENFLKNYKIESDDKGILESNTGDKEINIPQEKVFIHELIYTGKTPTEKFKDVKRTLKEHKMGLQNEKSFAIILNKLDDIAWLTNLRGGDIKFNPVFFSYAILYIEDDKEYLELYIDEDKIQTSTIHSHLDCYNIKYSKFDKFYSDIRNIPNEHLIIIDKNSCNQLIYQEVINFNKRHLLLDINVVEWTKAIKNESELNGFRECHKRDGAAVVRYLAWLEDQIIIRKNLINEYDGARKLFSFRKENSLFIEESFDTISSSGDNSAVIHYKPDINKCKLIDPNEIYLLDSGGQYFDGTTDTTRTVHFGNPTEREKEMYTRVLLGNLSVEKILLNKSKKLTGAQIDTLARQYLWRIGEDYGHGTGHGVGHCLNVHEGPHGISPRSSIPLRMNMVVTNEPGYYLKDKFGIRIENILLIQQHKNLIDYLCFENVTQVNYEVNLIDKTLLSKEIIDYVNEYHSSIFNVHEKYLKNLNDHMALDYLKRKTQYI